MKRSGLHAIAQWLQAQTPLVFFNNAAPILPILRGEKALPKPTDLMPWLVEQCRPRGLRRLAPGAHQRALRNLDGRSLLVGVEDQDVDLQLFHPGPWRRTNLLVVRDPANLFASRIRKARTMPGHPAYPPRTGRWMDRVIDAWKGHAREFVGRTDRLSDLVGIYFDLWFDSEAYRSALCQRLDIDCTDAGRDRVADYGGGSSFDGMDFDGAAAGMRVLDRVAMLDAAEREVLDAVMADPEIQELGEAIRESCSSLRP